MPQPPDLGICKYWRDGRGCRDLGYCPFQHTFELLHNNWCKRFDRGQCYANRCNRIHGLHDNRIRLLDGRPPTQSPITNYGRGRAQGVSPGGAAELYGEMHVSFRQVEQLRATVWDDMHVKYIQALESDGETRARIAERTRTIVADMARDHEVRAATVKAVAELYKLQMMPTFQQPDSEPGM